MPRVLNINSYSFNAKVAISLLVVTVFLTIVSSSLIIPKIQSDEYERTINEIEKVLLITEEQIKTAGVAIEVQSRYETKLTKKAIELDLEKLYTKSKEQFLSFDEIKKEFDKYESHKVCSYVIKSNEQLFINKNENIYKDHQIKEYNIWEEYQTTQANKSYDSKLKQKFYSKKINNTKVTVFCSQQELNINHDEFEKIVKKNVQNTFNTTTDLHKGKTYIFWLNSKYKNEDNKALFVKNTKERNEKYTISRISNVDNISTGNLSAKQIMEAANNGFIEHKIDGKEAISWIRNLYKDQYKNYIFLLVKTVYKDDLKKQIDSALIKILPASIISLFLALAIAFFLFKRLFKTINKLSHTAKEVNKGNNSIRSNVKGNDDIGNLGIAFDSMLDSFENNIKNLDFQVEKKTKELKESLEEKETLLKEIHHRVKNNLALTISLIKLQQAKIDDDKTKKILKDIQERIYTMELLHRKLYESPNLNLIAFKEYISNLTKDISTTYNYEKDVQIDINMNDIYLNIEVAMPCGLILNEIITNAFKYAFKEHENPKLYISMNKIANHYELIIKDNGEGIDKNIDIQKSSTLGLKLINSICKLQLNGEVKYLYEKGAVFKIRF